MSFDIVKHRVWWFTLSSVLVIASLISIFINGFNFGIDYTGGTILDMQFNKADDGQDGRQERRIDFQVEKREEAQDHDQIVQDRH